MQYVFNRLQCSVSEGLLIFYFWSTQGVALGNPNRFKRGTDKRNISNGISFCGRWKLTNLMLGGSLRNRSCR